jgi:uncharacterized membrane protein
MSRRQGATFNARTATRRPVQGGQTMTRALIEPGMEASSRNLFREVARDTQADEQVRSTNVGDDERKVSVAAGAILAGLGVAHRSWPGLLIAAVGGAMIYRGASGHCPVYKAMDIDTTEGDATSESHGIQIDHAFLVSKSPEELYQYWRNFENLPRIMSHLRSVQVIDEKKSHWVANAPIVAGGKVEWDAEITRDDANALIAWRSLPGSTIETRGEVRFVQALGDRGTEVHVYMEYSPPGGRLGHWIAKLFGEAPTKTIREDLRKFKQIMEVGEVATISGQPHGTCAGWGIRS